MSLVSTYAFADDGKWYKNPVLGHKNNNWFICFDDDDPIELVIADESPYKPSDIIAMLRLDAKITSKRAMRSERIFDGEFKPARAYWMEINKPIPAKYIIESDGVEPEIDDVPQGVMYDFGSRSDWA